MTRIWLVMPADYDQYDIDGAFASEEGAVREAERLHESVGHPWTPEATDDGIACIGGTFYGSPGCSVCSIEAVELKP